VWTWSVSHPGVDILSNLLRQSKSARLTNSASVKVVAMLAAIVHAVSWWPRWLLYEPLASHRMQGHKRWDASECQRFSQTATSLLFFCTSAFFANRVLLSKEWLFSREAWNPRRNFVEADFKFYYLLYIARFLSDLVSIFFEDRKRVSVFPLLMWT